MPDAADAEAAIALKELKDIFHTAGFGSAEIDNIKAGKIVKGALGSSTERDLYAGIGCVVKASVETVRQEFFTGRLEQGMQGATTAQVGTMDELNNLKLDESAIELYSNPAANAVNLSREEMLIFRYSTSVESVEENLREILTARYEQYRKSGLDGIPNYVRQSGEEYEPGAELKLKSRKVELLKKKSRKFYDTMKYYPRYRPSGLDENFSWVYYKIQNKPVVCLVHRLGMLDGGVYVYCQRHFYVTSGQNNVQGIGGAFPLYKNDTALVYSVLHKMPKLTDEMRKELGIKVKHPSMSQRNRTPDRSPITGRESSSDHRSSSAHRSGERSSRNSSRSIHSPKSSPGMTERKRVSSGHHNSSSSSSSRHRSSSGDGDSLRHHHSSSSRQSSSRHHGSSSTRERSGGKAERRGSRDGSSSRKERRGSNDGSSSRKERRGSNDGSSSRKERRGSNDGTSSRMEGSGSKDGASSSSRHHSSSHRSSKDRSSSASRTSSSPHRSSDGHQSSRTSSSPRRSSDDRPSSSTRPSGSTRPSSSTDRKSVV